MYHVAIVALSVKENDYAFSGGNSAEIVLPPFWKRAYS